MEKGTVTQYDDEFNGVIINEKGIAISVPGALVGEEIHYHIEHISPHAPKGWGRCDGLLNNISPDRVKPPCGVAWPVAGGCSGCPLMHVSDALEQKLKTQFVLNALQKAGVNYIHSLSFHSPAGTLNYRNRTDLVAAERGGRLVLGSYKPRSHDVIVTTFCPILRMPLNSIIKQVVRAANDLRIPACKPVVQISGALRYVSLFANENREVLVDLVCKSAAGYPPVWLESFAKRLMAFSPVRGVSYSLNDSPNNAIRVAPSQTICGVSRLTEHHGSTASLFSASGFTQLNTEIAAKIYQSAREWANMRANVVWDLYCGAGAFGRTFAPAKSLYGAEFSESAIEAARLVSQNDPFDTHFEVMDLEKVWPQWPEPDVVLVDPPRKGLSTNVIRHLLAMKPPAIFYMSCSPETFAQNVSALSESYVLERIEGFNMMPQTRHIELLGLLRKR